MLTTISLICISIIFHLAHFIQQQPGPAQCNETVTTTISPTPIPVFMTALNDKQSIRSKLWEAIPTTDENKIQQQRAESTQSTSSKVRELKQFITDEDGNKKPMPPKKQQMSRKQSWPPIDEEEKFYGRMTSVPRSQSRTEQQNSNANAAQCKNILLFLINKLIAERACVFIDSSVASRLVTIISQYRI